MRPTIERIGIYPILVNILLFGLNVAMAAFSGSLALAAEVVHNLADLTAACAVLAGLKLSQRKSRTFPYDLYKIENVVAVGVAFLIFFTAYEVAGEALLANRPRTVGLNARAEASRVSNVMPMVIPMPQPISWVTFDHKSFVTASTRQRYGG